MAHRFVAGAAPAEPGIIKYDEKTNLERSGFGRALKTGGVWQRPINSINTFAKRQDLKPWIWKVFSILSLAVSKCYYISKWILYCSSISFTSESVSILNSLSLALLDRIPLFCSRNRINIATVLSDI